MKGGAIIVAAALTAWPAAGQQPVRSAIPTAPVAKGAGWQDVSLAGYREHLEKLGVVVASCADVRDAKTCDPALVGPDNRVLLGTGAAAERRAVRYDWLRALLTQAQRKDPAATPHADTGRGGPAKADAVPAPPSTAELLEAAQVRLAADEQQAGGKTQAEPTNSRQRAAMETVLAGREFRGLEQMSPGQTVSEKVDNWLNSLFARAARLGARVPWLGGALVLGFILLVCAGLGWGLLQLERRWRMRLTQETVTLAEGAPSARDWQLWLQDARKAAEAGDWRGAIHLIYWAAIARLESRRLWPADRARTPREYLNLLAGDDPRRMGLAALTRSFERTWYGGRTADEPAYRQAEELATGLIGNGAGMSAARGGAAR